MRNSAAAAVLSWIMRGSAAAGVCLSLSLALGEDTPTPSTTTGTTVEPATRTTAPAEPPAAQQSTAIQTSDNDPQLDLESVVAAGQALFEQVAPPEISAEYEFPTPGKLRDFLSSLEADLANGSPARLAAYAPEARRALVVLRNVDGGDQLADWLEPRLDLLNAAAQIQQAHPAPPPNQADSTKPPPLEPERPQFERLYWDHVLAKRALPPHAAEFVPQLKEIFRSAGIPPELVWIAEVESAMNADATSPVGARGLFQFMPATAERFGLGANLLSDERTDPEKSARAAAAYLRVLHRRFQTWPLALAAYNAGEGRVGRALAREKATTYDAVSRLLPVETRMYVPKVLATVALREAIDPDSLSAPQNSAANAPQNAARALAERAGP